MQSKRFTIKSCCHKTCLYFIYSTCMIIDPSICIRLPQAMELERRVTITPSPLVPSYPHLRNVIRAEISSIQTRTPCVPKPSFKWLLTRHHLFIVFKLNFQWIFHSNICQKSIGNCYSSQAWFEVDFSYQNLEPKCGQEKQKPLKHRDCCSKTELAHFKTYGLVASSFGSNLLQTNIKKSLHFISKNISETNLIL